MKCVTEICVYAIGIFKLILSSDISGILPLLTPNAPHVYSVLERSAHAVAARVSTFYKLCRHYHPRRWVVTIGIVI